MRSRKSRKPKPDAGLLFVVIAFFAVAIPVVIWVSPSPHEESARERTNECLALSKAIQAYDECLKLEQCRIAPENVRLYNEHRSDWNWKCAAGLSDFR